MVDELTFRRCVERVGTAIGRSKSLGLTEANSEPASVSRRLTRSQYVTT